MLEPHIICRFSNSTTKKSANIVQCYNYNMNWFGHQDYRWIYYSLDVVTEFKLNVTHVTEKINPKLLHYVMKNTQAQRSNIERSVKLDDY